MIQRYAKGANFGGNGLAPKFIKDLGHIMNIHKIKYTGRYTGSYHLSVKRDLINRIEIR